MGLFKLKNIVHFIKMKILDGYSPKGLDRSNIFRHCMEFIKKNSVNGDFVEFGCYEGESTLRMLQAHDVTMKFDQTNRKFYVYDSFQGLPVVSAAHDLHPEFTAFDTGEYRSNLHEVKTRLIKGGFSAEQLTLVPGYFEQSLKMAMGHPPKIALAHIDVDLYTSCASVLEFLTDKLVDGSILIFDDYYCYRGHPEFGVPKAISEWQERNSDFALSEYCKYSWAGKCFIWNDLKLKP